MLPALELAFDRAKTQQEKAFKRSKVTERRYAKMLRTVAIHVGAIVDAFNPTPTTPDEPIDPSLTAQIEAALNRYSNQLDDWAFAVADRMVKEVAARDESSWFEVSRKMGRALRKEIAEAPTGQVMRERLEAQTALITSIPREAAERVRKLTLEGIVQGTRPAQIAKEIMRSGEVAESRAMLIARTEVSRTATELTRARAEYIGSTHFIWRTAGDSDVRPSHRALNGKTFRWDDPPECDPGHHALPGAIWNCFTGDTVIGLGNGIKRIFRSQFAGNIVDIHGSLPVSATANHPVLTGRGWVPAREVNKGDYLVKPVDKAKLVVDANMDDAKPTFEQLFEAFSAAKTKTPLGIKFNFHGDIPDGDVDCITFDQPLTDNQMAQALKGVGNLAFTNSDRGIVIIGDGSTGHVSEPLHTCSGDEISALAICHAPHADRVSITSASDHDIVGSENAADDAPVNSEGDRKGEFAFTGGISGDDLGLIKMLTVRGRVSPTLDYCASIAGLDAQNIRADANCSSGVFQHHSTAYEFHRVEDVRFRDFSGHVYTIETVTGWYGVTPASAIVKNCRCYPEPILRDD